MLVQKTIEDVSFRGCHNLVQVEGRSEGPRARRVVDVVNSSTFGFQISECPYKDEYFSMLHKSLGSMSHGDAVREILICPSPRRGKWRCLAHVK